MYEVGELVFVRDDDGSVYEGTVISVSTYEQEALVEYDGDRERWVSFKELEEIRDEVMETASWF